jgi:endonuclease/exonuclease/phosphatase family metal-dependent hydrolase
MKRLLVLLSLVLCTVLWSQDRVRLMTYNLLNYTISDTSRDASFRIVINEARPDILVVQEMTSAGAVTQFYQKVLQSVAPGSYAAGTFIDGTDTDNAIYFRSSLFSFVSNTPIRTALRDINEFTLVHNATAETLRVYSVHLKASSGSANEQKRAAEVDSLRKRTNTLPAGTNFIVVGDFNIYSSTEAAYQKLLADTPGDDGHFIDPISVSGTWNNVQYAIYHTQSPRLRSFGGGAAGGLDDRFDMILYSRAISEGGHVRYVPGSYTVVGNDGNHYNDSINKMPNSAVSQTVAQAMHDASDHLPVYAEFEFAGSGMPVQLLSFEARVLGMSVELRWTTATEVHNYGFDVERRTVAQSHVNPKEYDAEWKKVGYVQGAGTSYSPRDYRYVDASILPGRYAYRLKQIDRDGSFVYYSTTEIEVGAGVKVFALRPNYPNPFNPATTMEFTVPSDGRAVLKVYNTLGQEVALLFNEEAFAQRLYQVRFDASALPGGTYYAVLRHGSAQQTRKLLLVR